MHFEFYAYFYHLIAVKFKNIASLKVSSVRYILFFLKIPVSDTVKSRYIYLHRYGEGENQLPRTVEKNISHDLSPYL